MADEIKDEEKDAPATSAEGKAEEEEAKGFITPDDGESEPADGGEGSKEDGAPAAPEEKPEEKEKTGEDKAGDEPPKEAAATDDATGDDPGEGDGLIQDGDPKGVKKRIGRAVGRQHDAEKEAARLQGVIDGMNAKRPSDPEDETTPEIVRPVQEDFETEEAYIEALTDFKMDKRFAVRDAKNAEKATADQEAMATTSRREAFSKKIDEAMKKHEDYNDVVLRNPDLRINIPMLREIEESGNGAEVAYHLGKNPDEAVRIAALPQKAMERALWTIEEGLKTPATAPATTKTKTVSGAPDPIEPSGGGGGGSGRIDLETEPIEDFMKRENAKDLKKHGYG